MKKFLSFVLVSFILLINILLPISALAAEPALLTPISFTQPKDGELGTSTSSYDFSFTFTAPELTDEVAPPNSQYNVFFQPYCDGAAATSGSKYVFNQSKFIVGLKKENQRFLWNGNVVCPYYAKVLRWTLTEVDSTGKTLKTYVDASFKFKLNESYKGYYYLYLDEKGVLDYSEKSYVDEKSCKEAFSKFLTANPNYKKQTDCKLYDDIPFIPNGSPVVYIDGKTNTIENNTVYNMLAPIPGVTCMDSSGDTSKGCIGNDIGKYLNIIFKLAIGICAALAVVMLIINGITYMGDESIFKKTEAKSKMFSAIFGLLIAIGAWALLNTINPALTGMNSFNISAADVEVETQPLITNDVFTEGVTTANCSSGIVTAPTANGGIPICKTQRNWLIALIAKAKSEGINLFGYGYRSKATQEGLRAQNCGGPSKIYDAGATCKPKTAMPGKSLHENGLAVDFQCDGATIRSKDNKCFVWLKQNASPVFTNLDSEPWHWSTTGH